jgi:hypothetical protein
MYCRLALYSRGSKSTVHLRRNSRVSWDQLLLVRFRFIEPGSGLPRLGDGVGVVITEICSAPSSITLGRWRSSGGPSTQYPQ